MSPGAPSFRALFPAVLLLAVSAPVVSPALADEPCGEPENNFIWWEGFSGSALDGNVRALTMFQGSVVAAGEFGSAGGVENTDAVARWTESGWAAFGTPPGGNLRALAVYDGQLIIAGSHLSVDGVSGTSALARWDGSNWTSLGPGTPTGSAYALAVYDGRLIVGGDLRNAPANVMAWNGSGWSALGDSPDGNVFALLVHGDDLVAGGDFGQVGTLAADRIARWDGSAWNPLGAGLDDTVYALLADGDDVVAGGSFVEAGGQPAGGVARWDGAWHAYGDGIDGFIQALGMVQGTLYAGGGFYSPDPGEPSFLAAWTGSAWVPAGSGPDCNVYAMMEVDDELLVGGCFPTAGGLAAPYLAVWNGTVWDNTISNFGNGLSWYAGSFESYGDRLAVAGGFTHAGQELVNRIALWDGEEWSGLADGMNNKVFALTTFEGDLIAGGFFTEAGGSTANRVARWDGSSWSPVGDALGIGVVMDLVVYEGELYAAGDAGADEDLTIARWDGSAWQPLGSGVEGGENLPSVHAMAVYDGKLIAGGSFVVAGSPTLNSIAAWDGTSWSLLGSGVEAFDRVTQEPIEAWVEAIEVFDGKLYVAGDFTVAGGSPASNVASWDGANWSAVGEGLSSAVNALYAFEDRLVAGGPFLNAGSACRSRIAYWEGDGWKPMGTGVNGFVTGLGSWQGQLYAGGSFTRAGSTTSFGIARWATFSALVPVRLLSFTAQRNGDGGATIAWDVTDIHEHSGFHVYREASPENLVRLNDRLLEGGPHFEVTDPDPPAGPVRYRLAEVSRAGVTTWIGVTTLTEAPIPALALQPLHPNPFHAATRVAYSLPAAGRTTITVFDVGGRAVATLLDATQPAGTHVLTWNGTDDGGRRLGPGVYFVRIREAGGSVTRRVLLTP